MKEVIQSFIFFSYEHLNALVADLHCIKTVYKQ